MYLNMEQQNQIFNVVNDFLNSYLENNKGLTLEWWNLKDVLFLNEQKTTFIINVQLLNTQTQEIKKFEKNFFVKFKKGE